MKIAHIGDIHLGITMFGRALEEDQQYILNQITEKLAYIRPDVIVVAGDVFHTANPSAWGQLLCIHTLFAWSAIAPVRIIPGNHDNATRLVSDQPFFSLRDITVYLSPTVDNGILYVPFKSCDSPEEFMEYAMSADGSDTATVMVAHHSFIPADPKAFKNLNPLMFSNSPSAVPEQTLPDGMFVLAGHIHCDWNFGNVAYSSSPLLYNFDRTKSNPGFGVLTTHDTTFEYERIKTTPLHQLVLIEERTATDILADNNLDPNAYYRIVLSSAEELKDYAELLREKLPFILSIGAEQQGARTATTTTTTARGVYAQTFDEQVSAFCSYVGGEPSRILALYREYSKDKVEESSNGR